MKNMILLVMLVVFTLGGFTFMYCFGYEVGKEQEARRVWREERAREEIQRLQMEEHNQHKE